MNVFLFFAFNLLAFCKLQTPSIVFLSFSILNAVNFDMKDFIISIVECYYNIETERYAK